MPPPDQITARGGFPSERIQPPPVLIIEAFRIMDLPNVLNNFSPGLARGPQAISRFLGYGGCDPPGPVTTFRKLAPEVRRPATSAGKSSTVR
jgi:hypothetical protein